MSIDLAAAQSFLAAHGRLLDRRRFEQLHGVGAPAAVVAALDGYRNADGGYGWGLEPDLRAPESQPAGAMHALEVMAEVPSATNPAAVALCDWLHAHTQPDGGLPFALPVADPTGCAPWFLGADPAESSMQMTTQVAANAHLVARGDRAVAAHPWLARATDYCVDAITAIDRQPHAYELSFALGFVNAVGGTTVDADALLAHLRQYVPADGVVPVAGGTEGESLHALDFAPRPDGISRGLFADDVIASDLERVAGGQHDDGGWSVDYASFSPIAALEWRGYATVKALTVLEAYGI